jgi:hypothetical protein
MLREPTPDFMLNRIQQLRLEGHPETNLEKNIRWLVKGEMRPIGCPPVGNREDKFLEQLEIMRKKCVGRLANLIPENQEYSIFDALEARVDEGVSHEERIVEVVFNNNLSMHFENNEEDHALIRWLLEGEFLETDIDDKPNRTLVKDLEKNLICEGLPLHISSTWAAHGPEGPGTMGPTARLLCYWVRGEYLGSCSVTELEFVDEEQYCLFELRHEAIVPQTLENQNVTIMPLRRRVRMHALSKIEVFTLIPQGEVSERWVLRDSSARRYQHGLSESLTPGEDFKTCALRGLEEELGIEPPRIDKSLSPYGPTRVEWGLGSEGFDSSSMAGLPSIMCINPFYVKFNCEDDEDLIKWKDDGIPKRQFVIDDAGGTTLNWLPEATGLNVKETLGLINHEQGIQTNQWYALNYPDLPSSHDAKKVNETITAMIGTILLYHLPTNNQADTLIDSEDSGLLYTQSLWTHGGRSGKLGIGSFEKSGQDIPSLVKALIEHGIIEKYQTKGSKRKFKGYLSSIGRLLQPEIDDQLASDWLVQQISSARRNVNLRELSNEGVSSLLPWEPEFKKKYNKHTENLDKNEDMKKRWQTALNELFDILNNPEVWHFDGTLSSLLQNQPQFEGQRTIILFKRLEDGLFDVKLRKNVNLPIAQLHSDLLNHLREREIKQDGDDTLDDETLDRISRTVHELRERQAMVVRLE